MPDRAMLTISAAMAVLGCSTARVNAQATTPTSTDQPTSTTAPIGVQTTPRTGVVQAAPVTATVDSLVDAIKNGDVNAVKSAVAAGNVNAVDDTGATPLDYAINENRQDIVQALIDAGANINIVDGIGWTPLLFTSLQGNASLCDLLIQRGADTTAKTAPVQTEAPMVDESQDLTPTLSLGKERWQESTGAATDTLRQSISSWHHAMVSAHNKAIIGGIISAVADVAVAAAVPAMVANSLNTSTEFAASLSVLPPIVMPYEGLLRIVHRNGPDPSDLGFGTGGRTALDNAILAGDTATAKLLIAHGASIIAADEDGVTPIQLATEFRRNDIGALLVANGVAPSNLTQAIRFGTIDDVTHFLSSVSDVNAADEFGDPPMTIAAESGRADVINLLLARHANVNATNVYSNLTAVCYAAQAGHTDIVQLLMSKGARLLPRGASDYSPLHAAARQGHLDTVDLLLTYKPDVNARSLHVGTPLMEAVRGDHPEVVKALLDEKADIDPQDSYPPIFLAAAGGYSDVLSVLVAAGSPTGARYVFSDDNRRLIGLFGSNNALTIAIANARANVVRDLLTEGSAATAEVVTQDLRSVFNVKVGEAHLTTMSPLIAAVRGGDIDMMTDLIGKGAGADVNRREYDDRNCMTPLGFAVEANDLPAVQQLVANKANVAFGPDQDKPDTLLHLAAQYAGADIAKILTDNGLKATDRDRDQRTPLHIAAIYGNADVAEFLLADNADPNAVDKDSNTPFELAVQHNRVAAATVLYPANPSKVTVFAAALTGHLDDVQKLINANPALVSQADSNGDTPLHKAAAGGFTDVMAYLMANKANVEAKNDADLTPLDYAVIEGHPDAVQLLVNGGANVNARDTSDATPLHWAAYFARLDIAKMILAKNVLINQTPADGATPLTLAINNNDIEMVRLLIAHGADVTKVVNNMRPVDLAWSLGKDEIAYLLEAAMSKPVTSQ